MYDKDKKQPLEPSEATSAQRDLCSTADCICTKTTRNHLNFCSKELFDLTLYF